MRRERNGEAAFLRGEVGADGEAVEDGRDAAELEQARAREQLLRGRTWLGRELLTWLLWRSESGGALAKDDEGTGIEVLFLGPLTLRAACGDVVELVARGAQAPYAAEVRRALDAGLLVDRARVRLTCGEKVWEAGLDAERLDVRAAKLPELLSEADDDRAAERLWLAERLSAMVDALAREFLRVRAGRGWKRTAATMKEWMRERRAA